MFPRLQFWRVMNVFFLKFLLTTASAWRKVSYSYDFGVMLRPIINNVGNLTETSFRYIKNLRKKELPLINPPLAPIWCKRRTDTHKNGFTSEYTGRSTYTCESAYKTVQRPLKKKLIRRWVEKGRFREKFKVWAFSFLYMRSTRKFNS